MKITDKHISWRTVEYKHRPKSAEWFWAMGIISTAGAVASVLAGNILFAILIAIGGLTITLFAVRTPAEIEISLTKSGILIGTRLHLYSAIENFSVLYEEKPPLLILQTKNPIMPHLSIQIESVTPDNVRVFLSHFMEEGEIETSIPERIAELFGF